MLIGHSEINPNQLNKDGTTIYGVLFYYCLNDTYFTKKGFRPVENMKILLEKCEDKVDIHI